MQEEWKHVEMLPPSYEVSNLGGVRRQMDATTKQPANIYLSNGQYMISFEGKSIPVHRLVAEAFIPNPEGFELVKHKDGNKKNNNVDNLEWSDRKDIMRNAKRTDNKDKIYCRELDLVFGSMRSVTYLTRLPQDIIARAIKDGSSIMKLTFQLVKFDDPIIAGKKICYIDFDAMYSMLKECQSEDHLKLLLEAEVK